MKTLRFSLLATALLLPFSMASADVAADYKKNCASCHAADGSGNTKMGKKSGARDYRDAKVQASFSDSVALKAIKDGVKKDGKQKMKGYSSKLSDAQMKALVKYIRAFKK
jgi:mono/diheme cytochrome c family protein